MTQSTQYRYLVALPAGSGSAGNHAAWLSWRLLSTDPPDAPFHVERRGVSSSEWQQVTTNPVVDSTNLLDETPQGGVYEYRIITGNGIRSETVRVDTTSPPSLLALDVPLAAADDISGLVLGDLQNNGRMGYVLCLLRGGTVWLSTYAHNGSPLWEIDTRLPARGGWDGSALHVPFLCWDVNGDGRTEVAFHCYEGHFPKDFYDLGVEGEFLAVVDGETGDLVWKTGWPGIKPRVMMTVGHLHGLDRPPSIVILDETYRDVTLTAIDGQVGNLFWQVVQARPAGHNLDIGDIDEDGVQEVICGGVCYHGDGTVRWQAEPFGHTDISKPCKICPDRKGLQIWYAVENHNPGVYLVDKDGQTIFKEAFRHAHYGWIARHTNRFPGWQPHTAEDGRHQYGAVDAGMRQQGHFPIFMPDGSHWLNLTDWQRKNFVPVQWNQGPETVFIIRKENKRIVKLLENGDIQDLPGAKLPEGGRYGRNLACADVIGDFRENIVTIDDERHRLIVLANPTVAHHRGYSPFNDFAYRHDRSQLGSGYYIYLAPPDTVVNR